MIGDYDTKFDAMEKLKGLEGVDEHVKRIIMMKAMKATEELARRKRDEAVKDSIFEISPVATPLTGKVLKSTGAWEEDELTKPARKDARSREAALARKVHELEDKLRRKNVLKRNVDKRLREAAKKLKQIEEAVHRAREVGDVIKLGDKNEEGL